jgi:hypothetical protein
MLGVRRATVSEIAAQAQKDGLIEYRRGEMKILDRDGLEKGTCECYAIIRAEFERLLGKPHNNPRLNLPFRLPRLSKDGKSTAQEGTPRDAPRRAR